MQERKYRGISYETNTFVYGWLHQTKYESTKYFIRTFPNEDDEYVDVVVDKNTIGQEIGQTDKYGVKIFEGDIVKRTYNDGKYVELAVVEYDDYDCKFIFQGFNYDLDIHFYRLEVIGNIYENPELLEAECE